MIYPEELATQAEKKEKKKKEKKRKGTFSELGSAQPLSSFRIGKIQNLLKRDSFHRNSGNTS